MKRQDKMKKFTVYLTQPVLTWEGVKAVNEKDAIKQCTYLKWPPYSCDHCEPVFMEAIEEEGEE